MSEKVCTGTISLECHPKPPDKKHPDKPPEKPKQPPFLMITVVLLLLILTGIGGGAYTASSSDTICAPHDDDCNEPDRKPHKRHQRILKHGSRGADVKRLQKVLNARGLCPEPIVINGIFGPKTLSAVKEFQRQQNLRADGVVGGKTWDRLFASASN